MTFMHSGNPRISAITLVIRMKECLMDGDGCFIRIDFCMAFALGVSC